MATRRSRTSNPPALDAVTVTAAEQFLESRTTASAKSPPKASVAPTLFAGCFYTLWDVELDAPHVSPLTQLPYLFDSHTQAEWSRRTCMNAPQKTRHAKPRSYEIRVVRLTPVP